MLPGGLDVIGVFALAKPPMLTKSQAKLRQVWQLTMTEHLIYNYLNYNQRCCQGFRKGRAGLGYFILVHRNNLGVTGVTFLLRKIVKN